ncbi:MAG: AMP-binding protein [Lautropia sp.]
MRRPRIGEQSGPTPRADQPASVAAEPGVRDWTIDRFVDRAAGLRPARTAVVDRFGRMSWSEVAEASRRLAAGFARLGVGPGDRVAMQLPNWRHCPLVLYALARLGAVCVPLPPIYRQRELRFMLGLTRPKVAVIPAQFRGHDFVGMYRALGADLPELGTLVVAGAAAAVAGVTASIAGAAAPAGIEPFEALLDTPAPSERVPERISEQASQQLPVGDADALTEIVFTSGTTGEPKGVMHSTRTNLCPLWSLIAEQRLTDDEVVLMGSTFGHQTGFVYGGQLPAMLGGTLVLVDQWDARQGTALIEQERVSWTMGATPFLQDVVDQAGSFDPGSLGSFVCSGAPIPKPLLEAAREKLGARVASGWGMTEVGLVTLSGRDDDDATIAGSDGRAFPGSAVQVRDEAGQAAPAGTEGDLVCRGPSTFLGYYRRPELTAQSFHADGWLRTGDRARMDARGYIRITGRSKDIIIRGGENIPVVEVENLLHKHPAVLRAAVVAVPDPRLSERACAVVVLRPGTALDFEAMRRHLLSFELARQYLPEFLIVADELPMTPSGKIQKYLLRQQVLEHLGQGAAATATAGAAASADAGGTAGAP